VYNGPGTIALVRHDSEPVLDMASRPHSLAPAVVQAIGVIVDAGWSWPLRQSDQTPLKIEMVDLSQTTPHTARCRTSELHGDLKRSR